MSQYKPYPAYRDSGVEWLGKVPEHWVTLKIKVILSEKKPIKGVAIPAGAISFGEVVEKEMINTETLETYQEVLPGEFLINPINLNYDLKSLRVALSRIAVRVSPAYIVLRKKMAEQRFLRWMLYLFDVAHMKTLGAGVRQTITFEDIGNCHAALPPLSEQLRISNVLDVETARIDALVEKKTRFIELLREKRHALITHVVTKGLDPKARMKDSGVEWLGEVPAHWEVMTLKYSAESVTSGPRGWSELIDEGGDSVFVQSGDLNDNLGIDLNGASRIAVKESAETARTKLRSGDVVVCITGAKTGRVAIAEKVQERAYVNQHLCLVRPLGRRLDSRFLALFMAADPGQTQLGLMQYGLKEGLSLEDIRNLLLIIPPLKEQEIVVSSVNARVEQLDRLVMKNQRSIDLLKKRRAALITAAVTGQIDLRESA